jgi:hypothetical protein
VIGAIAAGLVLLGASLVLKTQGRYLGGIVSEDRSISNRIEVWALAPAMMRDAPAGWGYGNSGNAYMQWYQSPKNNAGYRTLVNSHLTWMVEFGWLFRAAYVAAWALVFLVCWPTSGSRWLSVPLATWATFFTGAFFSSVAEAWIIAVAPGLLLLAAVVHRLRTHQWFPVRRLAIPLVASALVNLLIFVRGSSSDSVHASSGNIVIGPGTPALWILYDDLVMGSSYGKTLRRTLESMPPHARPTIGVLMDISTAPIGEMETLVVCGKLPEKNRGRLSELLHSAKRVVLLNPQFSPLTLGIDSTGKKLECVACFGEFSEGSRIQDWQRATRTISLPAMGDYLPNWPAVVIGTINGEKAD